MKVPGKIVLMVGVSVLIGAAGFYAGYLAGSDHGREHFNRSFAYEGTYDLHELVTALRDLRNEKEDTGIKRLDLLVTRKLESLPKSTNHQADEYKPDEVSQYLEQYHGSGDLAGASELGRRLSEELSESLRPPVVQVDPGEPAPDFELTTLEGKAFRLADTRGRVVLLTFFATWCSPCVAELNHWKRDLMPQYKDRGLEIVVVAPDPKDTTEKLQAFVQKNGYPFTFVRDEREKDVFSSYVARGGGGRSIPVSFLIGSDGVVAEKFEGYSEESYQRLVSKVSSLYPEAENEGSR